MSYTIISQTTPGRRAAVHGLGVDYPPISGMGPCLGGQYWYNKAPASATKEACCGPTTWNESTWRALRPDVWQAYLEDIVRRNVEVYLTKDGVDNAAYDIPMQYQQAPSYLDYSAKLVAAVDRARGNFEKLYQPRAMIVGPNGQETFCTSSGRYQSWTDPGNPDLALQAAGLRDIFKRDPSPDEVIAFYTSNMAMFAEIPRWFTANLKTPPPIEWGDGSWGMQPPSANVGDFWWWDATSLTLQPKPWTKQFLDTMAPGWNKALPTKVIASASVKKQVTRSATRVLAIASTSSRPMVAVSSQPAATPLGMSAGAKVAVIAGVGVALASLGYVGYRLTRG